MPVPTAFERVREANPVPEPRQLREPGVDLAPLVAELLTRGHEPTTSPTADKPSHRRKRAGWAIAVAAVAVATVFGLALLTSPSETVDIADSTPSPPVSPEVLSGIVTIEANDFELVGVPEVLTVGSAIELVNRSTDEFHLLAAVKLFDDDPRTVGEFMAEPADTFWSEEFCIQGASWGSSTEGCSEDAEPSYELWVGSIHAYPGERAFDGRLRFNAPGRYLILDMTPRGADPEAVGAAVQSNQAAPMGVPGGPLNYTQGMIAEILVVDPGAEAPATSTIEAFDYGFRGVPDTVPVGTALEMTNTSATEAHAIYVLELHDGDARTVAEFSDLPITSFYGGDPLDPGRVGGLLFCVPPAEKACNRIVGWSVSPPVGTTFDRPLDDGAPQSLHIDAKIRLNSPGRYLIIDPIPSGADPDAVELQWTTTAEPWELGGGPLNYAQGMIAIIEVVDAEAPEAAGPEIFTVEAYDFGFTGIPEQMAVGSALELFNTSPTEFHNLAVARLPDDTVWTIEDIASQPPEAFYSDQEGRPLVFTNAVGVIHARPGESAYDGRVRINVPGRYLVVDLVPEGADIDAVMAAVEGNTSPMVVPGGLVGYQQGMIAIIEVVD